MKKVIIYFSKKAIVESAQEAVNFINTLQYRGNSYSLKCNKHTEELLKELFSNENHPYHSYSRIEIATTGCSTTRIYMYKALADSLEKHDAIVLKNQQKEEAERKLKAEKTHQEWLKEMCEELKGWYVVTVTGSVMKIKGNDGNATRSVKVLANNQMDAYDKAVEYLENNPKGNIISWLWFESAGQALIEYVGIWTDAAELEYK